MFHCQIPAGAIFYTGAHRRDEVALTEPLRELTRKTADAVKKIIDSQKVPAPSFCAKCRKCSMVDVCQPKWKGTAKSYCEGIWREVLQEETL